MKYTLNRSRGSPTGFLLTLFTLVFTFLLIAAAPRATPASGDNTVAAFVLTSGPPSLATGELTYSADIRLENTLNVVRGVAEPSAPIAAVVVRHDRRSTQSAERIDYLNCSTTGRITPARMLGSASWRRLDLV